MTNKEIAELIGKEIKFNRPATPNEPGFFAAEKQVSNSAKDAGRVMQVNIDTQITQKKGSKVEKQQHVSILVYSRKLKKLATISPKQIR